MESLSFKELYKWKTLTQFLISYILLAGVLGYFGSIIVGLDIEDHLPHQSNSTFQNFIVTLFELIGAFYVVWLFRKKIDKSSVVSLGFKKKIGKAIIGGFLTGFIIMFSGFCSLLLLKQVAIIGIQYHIYALLLNIGLFLAIAFAEEVIIRGYVLNKLLGLTNKHVALIISSVIFSLFHVLNPNFNFLSLINLFFAGILLGITYIYTKNLWFPIALHFSWNFFQGAIFGFNVSGMEFHSIFIQKIQHNNIWNGGAFGFEGSILCVLFQIIGILILFLIYNGSFKLSFKRFFYMKNITNN